MVGILARPTAARRARLTYREDLFGGTFAPFFRASDRPMAMACLRLFTLPWRPLPDLRVPAFFRLMALLTDFPAALPYRFREPFRLAMSSPLPEP
jgi:hypothetical protein